MLATSKDEKKRACDELDPKETTGIRPPIGPGFHTGHDIQIDTKRTSSFGHLKHKHYYGEGQCCKGLSMCTKPSFVEGGPPLTREMDISMMHVLLDVAYFI